MGAAKPGKHKFTLLVAVLWRWLSWEWGQIEASRAKNWREKQIHLSPWVQLLPKAFGSTFGISSYKATNSPSFFILFFFKDRLNMPSVTWNKKSLEEHIHHENHPCCIPCLLIVFLAATNTGISSTWIILPARYCLGTYKTCYSWSVSNAWIVTFVILLPAEAAQSSTFRGHGLVSLSCGWVLLAFKKMNLILNFLASWKNRILQLDVGRFSILFLPGGRT